MVRIFPSAYTLDTYSLILYTQQYEYEYEYEKSKDHDND